ncbi:hypothetical protein [Streptomyces griseus]|uniref:hypothetical protein n=1 Tax=Streptomyces griseus TaxID=1911 RepID=UPI00367D060E
MNPVPDVLVAPELPLPLALKVSGPAQTVVPRRPLTGERFDADLQVRVDRDGSPLIRNEQYHVSSTAPVRICSPAGPPNADVASAA